MENLKKAIEDNRFAILAVGLLAIIAVLLFLQISITSQGDDSDRGRDAGSSQSFTPQTYIEEARENNGEVVISDEDITQEEFIELQNQLEENEEIESVQPSGSLLRVWQAEIDEQPLHEGGSVF